jgi:DNA polymerase V
MMALYDRIMDPDLLIRRLNVSACALIRETEIPPEVPVQLDLFTDYAELERKRAEEQAAEEKEKKLQKATLLLQEKYGKNAVLKGMNLDKRGTTIARNGQIGGHKAGDAEPPLPRKKVKQP